MARRDDEIKDDSYSSTVRKVLVTNNGSEITADNPLPVDLTRTNITLNGDVQVDVSAYRDVNSNARDALVDSSDRIILSPESNLTVAASLDTNDSITSYQGGIWTVDRTWNLNSSTDSITSYQGGTWTVDRTWNLNSNTDSSTSYQGGTWAVDRTWNLDSSTDNVNVNIADGSYSNTEKYDNLDRRDLLESILIELKKLNMHMQCMTDERIKEDDIECQ